MNDWMTPNTMAAMPSAISPLRAMIWRSNSRAIAPSATPAPTNSLRILLRSPVRTTIGNRPYASGTANASAASETGTRTCVSCGL